MFLTIVAFVFVLSIVVLVHEWGHFIVAKMNGIYVITFSIGFGPKILKFRLGETEYALSALPFGGYVKFAGENEDEQEEKEDDIEKDIPEDRLYKNKSPLQRMSVVLAGPAMNAALAIILYIMNIWVQGVFLRNPGDVISEVVDGSPAAEARFEVGDRIIEINGDYLEPGEEISDLVDYSEGVSSTFRFIRGADTLTAEVTPRWNEEAQRLTIGIFSGSRPLIGDVKKDSPAYKAGLRSGALVLAMNDTTVITYLEMTEKIYARNGIPITFTWELDGELHREEIVPVPMDAPSGGEKLDVIKVGSIGIGEYYEKQRVSFPVAVKYGSQAFGNLFMSIMSFLGKLVTGKATIRAVGGPIRVGVMAGDMIRWGFSYLINFLAFFSMNLAIFNLLPVLPFDGGHFVIFVFEAVTGIKPGQKVQNILSQIGFIILIALMVMILFLDLFNLIR